MSAATRESARERMIRIMALVLVISIGFLVPKAAAQSDKYPKMAPVDQYLMERNAEILLARSAAPDSISSDATILVLGRQGYETGVRGTNGFVCMVERSWMAAFDSPEFWNPKVRGGGCLNRQAARSILPIAELRTRMVMAGHSKAEIVSILKGGLFRHYWILVKFLLTIGAITVLLVHTIFETVSTTVCVPLELGRKARCFIAFTYCGTSSRYIKS